MAIRKRGKVWCIDYYDQNHKRHVEAIGPNKRLAEQVLAKRIVQVKENKFLNIRSVPQTKFEEMASLYLNSYAKIHKRSWTRDQTCIKNLLPHFKGKLLQEIAPLDIDRYQKVRLEKVSPRTVNIEVKFLKALYNKAIGWGKANTNPVSKVRLFRENDGRIRFLAQEEIRRLMKACPDHLRPIVLTAITTGMRKQEILQLTWDNVDLERRLIYIVVSKNGHRREVPINSLLFETLKCLEKNRSGPYVFCKTDGTPYGDVRTSFKTALKKADIEDFRSMIFGTRSHRISQ